MSWHALYNFSISGKSLGSSWHHLHCLTHPVNWKVLFYGLEWIYNVICGGFKLDFSISPFPDWTKTSALNLASYNRIISESVQSMSSCPAFLSSTALLRDLSLLLLLSVFLFMKSWQCTVLSIWYVLVDWQMIMRLTFTGAHECLHFSDCCQWVQHLLHLCSSSIKNCGLSVWRTLRYNQWVICSFFNRGMARWEHPTALTPPTNTHTHVHLPKDIVAPSP